MACAPVEARLITSCLSSSKKTRCHGLAWLPGISFGGSVQRETFGLILVNDLLATFSHHKSNGFCELKSYTEYLGVSKFGKGALIYGDAAPDQTSKIAFQRVPKVKEF